MVGGDNARYLAQKGFKVEALDISPTAIESLKDIENIEAHEVDLDGYILKKNAYDLIVMTYFLGREFLPQFYDALKPNGILILEHWVNHPENSDEFIGAKNLFNQDELSLAFSKNFTILHFSQQKGLLYNKKEIMCESIVVKK